MRTRMSLQTISGTWLLSLYEISTTETTVGNMISHSFTALEPKKGNLTQEGGWYLGLVLYNLPWDIHYQAAFRQTVYNCFLFPNFKSLSEIWYFAKKSSKRRHKSTAFMKALIDPEGLLCPWCSLQEDTSQTEMSASPSSASLGPHGCLLFSSSLISFLLLFNTFRNYHWVCPGSSAILICITIEISIQKNKPTRLLGEYLNLFGYCMVGIHHRGFELLT